jgi:hypothetical protein
MRVSQDLLQTYLSESMICHLVKLGFDYLVSMTPYMN